mmetsp:Transcript_72895/g.165327  ORF Transcript_72895/g.165327 Transcript_72895/m.165327 type:complete len:111 (-) Transcript_72895:54-386(-)
MGRVAEAIAQENKWAMRWHNAKMEAEQRERDAELRRSQSLGPEVSQPPSTPSLRSSRSRSSAVLPAAGAMSLEAGSRPGTSGAAAPPTGKLVTGLLLWRGRGQCGPRGTI